MRVLVTGGAGYIGSHTCKALAAAGHEVVVFDSLRTGHEWAVKWGPLERGDVRDTGRIAEVIGRHDPDLVMHFAALAYVGESVLQPAEYYDVNVVGTLSLLKAMQAARKNRIVFSSSCATYGVPDNLPIREDTPQSPVNPYGFTKFAAERLLADFEQAYGLGWTALRYFNAAGADPDGELGEEHDPETHAMPLAIMAALDPRRNFTVLGRDFPTADGTAIRDYIHVADLASAHVAAAERLIDGGSSISLNLGTGRGTSVLELVETVTAVVGRPLATRDAERRPGDPPMLYADPSLAHETLGWATHYTLNDMVATAAAWFRRKSDASC